jgi:hypothetical protein
VFAQLRSEPTRRERGRLNADAVRVLDAGGGEDLIFA